MAKKDIDNLGIEQYAVFRERMPLEDNTHFYYIITRKADYGNRYDVSVLISHGVAYTFTAIKGYQLCIEQQRFGNCDKVYTGKDLTDAVSYMVSCNDACKD